MQALVTIAEAAILVCSVTAIVWVIRKALLALGVIDPPAPDYELLTDAEFYSLSPEGKLLDKLVDLKKAEMEWEKTKTLYTAIFVFTVTAIAFMIVFLK